MKSLAKYLLIAALPALALVSCKEEENEFLNPKGTPVQFTLSGDNAFSDNATANVKVTASAPVPADVTVTLALGEGATITAEKVLFPNLTILKDQTEASGQIALDLSALTPGTTYKVVLKASLAGVDLAQKLTLSYTTEEASPVNIVIDGDSADWDELDPKDVVTIEGSPSAEKTGLVSAMVYYADKLYLLLELSNDALAQSKIRFHLYFNSNFDSDGGYSDKWGDLDIDYATEGKIADGGNFVEYSSPLYKTKPGTVWGTEQTGYTPVFKSAGNGILYELSMDYTDFPGGLADVFSLGLDIANDTYDCTGFLPNKGANPEKAVIKKAGYTKVGGITIDGDMKDWAAIEGLSDPESYLQAFKVTYDDDYIYFYNKRNWNDALWGVEAGYYYFCLDLDNNASTTLEGGANGNEIPGLDAWMFVYPFLGSAEAPEFGKANLSGDGYPENCFKNLICEGRFNEAKTYIETEMRVPRADMGVNKGVINCFSWGNKSASNLKSTPLTITIEK